VLDKAQAETQPQQLPVVSVQIKLCGRVANATFDAELGGCCRPREPPLQRSGIGPSKISSGLSRLSLRATVSGSRFFQSICFPRRALSIGVYPEVMSHLPRTPRLVGS